jgi:hypothetical protein
MDYPNSIPDLEHKHNLRKMIMERLENDLMETKKSMQEATSKHDQTMSQYLHAQADFMKSFTKLNEARVVKSEFDETFKSAIDCCTTIKKDLKSNSDSAD